MSNLCGRPSIPTGYEPKFCKLVVGVTNVHLQDSSRSHERRAMETNSSTPEPKNDEDVNVLAVLQKMSAILDGLERQISAARSSAPLMVKLPYR